MGYHLPFYRQAQKMAVKGITIERSTLARSAGYAVSLLDPIYNRIRELGRLRFKIHIDDTRLHSAWMNKQGGRHLPCRESLSRVPGIGEILSRSSGGLFYCGHQSGFASGS